MNLDWGRHYLMCPPDFFGVEYEINPWMNTTSKVDRGLAMEQWLGLVATIEGLGATIDILPAVPGLPDLVFTANAGLITGRRFFISRFAHEQRRGESAVDRTWFEAGDYEVLELPEEAAFEGAGDALPFGSRLFAGYGPRSTLESHRELALLTNSEIVSLHLVDERLYHLDLGFCPLDDEHALIAPLAFDRYSLDELERIVPAPIYLEDDEALGFCANSLVIDNVIIMGSVSPRLSRVLAQQGFEIVSCRVDEFLKAGGGCRCLTLALDVQLHDLAGESRARPSEFQPRR